MMTTFERRQTILRLLKEQPGVKVARLAETLDVSEGTIRNDLTSLENDRKIERVRGGAILVEQPDDPSSLKLSDNIFNAKTKKRIARWAAEMLEDGDAILMDASTTVRFMVPFFARTSPFDDHYKWHRNSPLVGEKFQPHGHFSGGGG